MPLLLLIPLLALAAFTLWAVLLPLSLLARYRSGRARRRAQGWVVRGNAWLLALSVPLFLLSAWLVSNWLPLALSEALTGLLIGSLLGLVSLWLTRFEHDADGFHYTPNRWLVLALTMLVALRLLAGLWLAWRQVGDSAASPVAAWLQSGGWLGVAGVLLGYYLGYTWGLRARLPRRPSRQA